VAKQGLLISRFRKLLYGSAGTHFPLALKIRTAATTTNFVLVPRAWLHSLPVWKKSNQGREETCRIKKARPNFTFFT
jgi:hypothetical protein